MGSEHDGPDLSKTIHLVEAERPPESIFEATRVLARAGVELPATPTPQSLSESATQNTILTGASASKLRLVSSSTLEHSEAFDSDGDIKTLGRFQLIRELGRGGMGRVLEAYDPELGRSVAIKIIADTRKLRPSQLASFVAEAQITSQLEHPNIVPIHDMGVTRSGHLFFVMKRVVGRSLGDILRRLRSEAKGKSDANAHPEDSRARWTLHRRMNVLVQVCNGVAYAHDRGVAHRDLKPDNIMLGRFGETLVMDWGLAHVRRGQAQPGGGKTVAGTPGYISPEELEGATPGPGGDVWSLGVVLYELLTLRRPFKGKTLNEMREAVAGPLPDPRERALDMRVPDDLVEICRKALAADLATRYRSAAQLGRAVEEFLEGSRRRERADAFVTEARTLLSDAAELQGRAATLRGEAKAALAMVPPFAPESDKAPGWALEDEAAGLEADAALNEVRFQQAARNALEQVRDLASARQMLAGFYRSKHEQAEARRDHATARGLELLLHSNDSGEHADYLRGTGTVSLVTDPAGAEVTLQRYVERGRRLVLEPTDIRAQTPIATLEVPRGSYVATIRAPGRAEVRYPLTVERLKHWSGARPGEETSHAIALPAEGELGPDDMYIPAGWALTGGDDRAAGGLPSRRLWFDAFVVRRHPVTHREYIEFLNALVAAGRDDDARRHAPAEMGAEGAAGKQLYTRGGDGRFALQGGGPWTPNAPVSLIEWSSAMAYARHVGEQTGHAWRLLDELEWEKAARGVDGRYFPWGWTQDPSWACTAESHAGPPTPPKVTDYPTDESPYGVRGLTGGIRDWCFNTFIPSGPEVGEDLRVIPRDPGTEPTPRITRGGAWSLPDWVGRICCRGFHPPIRLGDLGMRLARSYGPSRSDA